MMVIITIAISKHFAYSAQQLFDKLNMMSFSKRKKQIHKPYITCTRSCNQSFQRLCTIPMQFNEYIQEAGLSEKSGQWVTSQEVSLANVAIRSRSSLPQLLCGGGSSLPILHYIQRLSLLKLLFTEHKLGMTKIQVKWRVYFKKQVSQPWPVGSVGWSTKGLIPGQGTFLGWGFNHQWSGPVWETAN